MLDLERADAGLGGVSRLQPGDHPAAVVAQLAGLVEIGAIAVADEAAVALEIAAGVGKRRAERARAAPAAPPARSRRGAGELRRQSSRGGEHRRAARAAISSPSRDGGEIARTAAIERQPRRGAGDVGRRRETLADRLAEAGFGEHPGDRIETAR